MEACTTRVEHLEDFSNGSKLAALPSVSSHWFVIKVDQLVDKLEPILRQSCSKQVTGWFVTPYFLPQQQVETTSCSKVQYSKISPYINNVHVFHMSSFWILHRSGWYLYCYKWQSFQAFNLWNITWRHLEGSGPYLHRFKVCVSGYSLLVWYSLPKNHHSLLSSIWRSLSSWYRCTCRSLVFVEEGQHPSIH